MEAPSLPGDSAGTPEKLDYLSLSERRAYADLASTSQPLMQVGPKAMRRLLAQVEAQAQQLALHERREKGLREAAEGWKLMAAQSPAECYGEIAEEVADILANPHFGDPAYDEPDMEHDGTGWVVPRPWLNELRGLAS